MHSAVSITRSLYCSSVWLVGPGPIDKLRQRDRVRLVPDNERISAGAFPPVESHHLGPPRARQSPLPRQVPRCRQSGPVPRQVLFQQLRPPPQRKVRRVPPDHLRVMLAEPGVGRQPAFLRRRFSDKLDPRQILRQHHPPLQLEGPRIRARGKINSPSAFPKLRPPLLAGLSRLGHCRQGGWQRIQSKPADKLQNRRTVACREPIVMLLRFLDRRLTEPCDARKISRRIHDPFEIRPAGSSLRHPRLVPVRQFPLQWRRMFDGEIVPVGKSQIHP